MALSKAFKIRNLRLPNTDFLTKNYLTINRFLLPRWLLGSINKS